MILRSLFALLMLTGLSAHAQEQVILDTRLGEKSALLEQLQSASGRLEIAGKLSTVLSKIGNSAYIVLESPDHSEAMLISVYAKEKPDKTLTLKGSGFWFYRNESTPKKCTVEAMKTMDLGQRADGCYYADDGYSRSGYPQLAYDSVEKFVNLAHGLASEYAFAHRRATQWIKTQGLETEFKSYLDAFQTTKMYSYLLNLFLNSKGYDITLESTQGWSKKPVQLDTDARKIHNGILFLQSKGEAYLSKNVVCSEKDVARSIVSLKVAQEKQCKIRYLMGEYPADFFEAMGKKGYHYNEPTQNWQ